MLEKKSHETSASEVPRVKSYDMLKSGYVYGGNVKKATQPKLRTFSSWWLVAMNKRTGLCNKRKVLLLHRPISLFIATNHQEL